MKPQINLDEKSVQDQNYTNMEIIQNQSRPNSQNLLTLKDSDRKPTIQPSQLSSLSLPHSTFKLLSNNNTSKFYQLKKKQNNHLPLLPQSAESLAKSTKNQPQSDAFGAYSKTE